MAKAQQQQHDPEAYKLVDTNRDTEREFESWQEAQEKRNDMVSLGANPEDLEIRPVENRENGHEPEIESDMSDENGETANSDEQDDPEQKQEPVEVVESAENRVELDERSITDDPIQWLNRNANDFVDEIQGTQAINKKGFRVLQHFYDIDVSSEVVVAPEETEFEYCRVKARAEMPDGRIAEAHGSAHVDRDDDHFLLLEMADTRAKSRALSDITGVGAVAVAELKGGSTDA